MAITAKSHPDRGLQDEIEVISGAVDAIVQPEKDGKTMHCAEIHFEIEVPEGFIAPIELGDGRLFSVDRSLRTFYSADDGQTWDAAGRVANSREQFSFTGSTYAYSLCRFASGTIGLTGWDTYPSRSKNTYGLRIHKTLFTKSLDEGKTWSANIPIAPPHTPAFVTFLVQTKSGRLIVPCEYAFNQAQHQISNAHHKMSVCTIFYSDDEGETWMESADSAFVRSEDGSSMHLVEAPCTVETSDGRLLTFMRTEMQRLAQSYSEDGGVHWSPTELNQLVSSRSEVHVLRIPSTGDLLCVWNQVSGEETRTGFHRARLSSAISKDSGKTWEHFRTIVQSAGMRAVERIAPTSEPKHLRAEGAVPAAKLIAAEGFRSVHAPRVSIINEKAYMVFDDRLYGRSSKNSHGWEKIYNKHKLRVLPVQWFYGEC